MKIKSYIKGDAVVLEPVGKLMGGLDVGQLDEQLYALLEKEQKKVVLDLGKTEWINSSTIAILIHHRSKFLEIGGGIKLANLTKKVRQVIAITKMTHVFEVYDTVEAALES
jgi:anti-sigma B factor antagonist